MGARSDKNSISEKVLARLKAQDKPLRVKKTLVLSELNYEVFDRLCRKEKRYPSDVIDEFIKVYVEEQQEGK